MHLDIDEARIRQQSTGELFAEDGGDPIVRE
jgi:hypothetical protein